MLLWVFERVTGVFTCYEEKYDSGTNLKLDEMSFCCGITGTHGVVLYHDGKYSSFV